MKTYRGAPAAARTYLQADPGRGDDYYLAEGTGIAERYVASPEAGVHRATSLSGDGYEAWVAGVDPETGVAKGRLRQDDQAVRFVEVTVNGPKSWSLAAELHPEISAAYDAAQDRAATQIIGWLADHATTRVGPRGQQVQMPLQQIEAAVVRHYTSRANDPHRHLHLQINARVFAAGAWRGLHTVGVRDSLEAINGIGHAAVVTDPGFREALATHGFNLDEAGEIVQLAPFTGAFSARAAQIARTIEGYEADWQVSHPGQTAGPALRRSWDARAWADGRPDKVHPAPGADLNGRWRSELAAFGYTDPGRGVPLDCAPVGAVDRERAVDEVLTRLAARRSGWNAADLRGEVELLLARRGIVTSERVRLELAEDLTARAVESCLPLLNRAGVPEHIRALTSPHVIEVEADLAGRLAARANAPAAALAEQPTQGAAATVAGGRQLDETQTAAALALAGDTELMVIEGAAGAGKTSTLSAARDLLAARGRRLMVVTPTLKAAKVAQAELESGAGSAAWLAFQHGYRWDSHGAWSRLAPGQPDPQTGDVYCGPGPAAVLRAGDLLLVDEAGMLDQDTARALMTVADEHRARLALIGDRRQMSAIGRGGVLDLAARWVDPNAHHTLETVHRFTRETTTPTGQQEVAADVEYAQLSLAMRTSARPQEVFAALLERGQVRVYATDAARLAALAEVAAGDVEDGGRSLIVADTRDQIAELNNATRDRLVTAGIVDDTHATTTSAGQRIGVGDRVVTRRNNAILDIANRDTWIVTQVDADGSLKVTGHPTPGQPTSGQPTSGLPGAVGARHLPADYVIDHVDLAYACTVHGVQGDTAHAAHLLLGEHTGASSAYVGMTRGRIHNTAHLVADSVAAAREQWVAAFSRDRADLGAAHAAQLAAREAANYARPRPFADVIRELRAAWTVEQDCLDRLAHDEPHARALREIITLRQRRDTELPALHAAHQRAREAAEHAAQRLERTRSTVSGVAGQLRDALLQDWDAQRQRAVDAAMTVNAGTGRFGQRRGAVTAAKQVLADWSQAWQPYLPAMPTDPTAVTRFALWADYRPSLQSAFDQWAQRRSLELHPEHAAAQRHAAQARDEAQQAALTHTEAAGALNRLLWRHGTLARIPDPETALVELKRTIDHTRARLRRTQTTITALTAEPAVTTQATGRITDERHTWAQDRQHERDAARHAAAHAARSATTALPSQTPQPTFYRQHNDRSGPALGI